jgi:hypothetical protein
MNYHVKIKEEFIKDDLPTMLRESASKNNKFELITTIGVNILIADNEGNLFEIFPRKCRLIDM